MSSTKPLSVKEFLELYESDQRNLFGWIDVRSEGEFATASLPGFENIPILTNEERHRVGLTYKQKGQSEAVKLGHELVDPHREERVQAWSSIASRSRSGEAVMICWRGGMRSGIASEWLRASGTKVRSVQGGIKAIRGELLLSLNELPELLILSGLTGSGKTELLRKLAFPKIDLESLAKHRGSSFGASMDEPQPAQATFENLVLLALRQNRGSHPVIVEDESSMIGSCYLPREMKSKMSTSPSLWVESTMEERVARIYSEYVAEPLARGHAPDAVAQWMLASLLRIQRKLGGRETAKQKERIETAFQKSTEQGFSVEHHREWIERLLELYYDPMYRYGFEKNVGGGRKTVFRGTHEECIQWLKIKFASHKP